MKRQGLFRLLLYVAVCALFWVGYCIAIHLGWNAIFWIYLSLFSAGAVLYVIAVRGNLSPLPTLPPSGREDPSYTALRERVEAARRRFFWLPPIVVGTAFSLLLDAVNLFLLDGIFL